MFAQAIAERRLTAASLVEDSPAQITTAGGLYIPQNYDRQFKGWVSVRTALAASLNVPAVRTLVMVTPDAFHRQLGAMGLPLRESGDYFGYSLALGSPEVPLLHLTNAYRTLANGGRASPVAVTLANGGRQGSVAPADAKPRFTPAIDPRAAYIVGDILSDGNARARTFGTDSVLATRFWTAVKTGTSKDMRDNWAVGWSERYTVGVWVGNASGAAMHEVSGTSGAAPIWAAVMGFLHAREPSRAPKAPGDLVRAAVRFGPGQPPSAGVPQPLEAARDEWFVPGTQQSLFAIDSIASEPYSTSASGQKGCLDPYDASCRCLCPHHRPGIRHGDRAGPGHPADATAPAVHRHGRCSAVAAGRQNPGPGASGGLDAVAWAACRADHGCPGQGAGRSPAGGAWCRCGGSAPPGRCALTLTNPRNTV